MVNPALPIWPKLALNMSASKNGDGGRRQFTGQSNSRFEHGKIPANLPKILALHHLRIWKTGYEIPGLIPGTRFATRVPGYPGKSLFREQLPPLFLQKWPNFPLHGVCVRACESNKSKVCSMKTMR